MTPREERGLIIAALCKLQRIDGAWLVPSQASAEKKYVVNLESQTCSCPDHQETGLKCKHQFAVEFTLKRELSDDGTVSETRSITFAEKVTYTQNWPVYNEAQATEKHRFQVLLADLCRGVPTPPRTPGKQGRHKTLYSDAIFAATFKVYTTVSTRRFACDLKDAYERGHLSKPIHYNCVIAYLENAALTPILHDLIVRSSLPLRAVETTFAPDSSGFSVSRFVRWFDEKYGVQRSGKDWVKAHAISGVKTGIVTAVKIEGRDAADCPQFKPLVEKTAENFTVKEVPADKAYLSHDNLELVEKLGGTAYIPFKSNSVPGEAGSLWEKMFFYFKFRQNEFLQHYHQRSNAESLFSAVKRKFGDNVRSRTDVAMKNEVLCKFLCHNICVVHHEQLELGIEPVFWPNETSGDNSLVLPFTRPVG